MTSTHHPRGAPDHGLSAFNAMAAPDLVEQLLACCAVPSWARAVEAGRPFDDRAALTEFALALVDRLREDEIDLALAAHPRIGDRATGSDTESRWSRAEQGDVSRDAETVRRLDEGNRAYEQRFGQVFLVCATGLEAPQVLGSLEQRLANDAATELSVVRRELGKIVVIRLAKVLDGTVTSERAKA